MPGELSLVTASPKVVPNVKLVISDVGLLKLCILKNINNSTDGVERSAFDVQPFLDALGVKKEDFDSLQLDNYRTVSRELKSPQIRELSQFIDELSENKSIDKLSIRVLQLFQTMLFKDDLFVRGIAIPALVQSVGIKKSPFENPDIQTAIEKLKKVEGWKIEGEYNLDKVVKAYRKLVLKVHPDKEDDEEEKKLKAEKCKKLNTAYNGFKTAWKEAAEKAARESGNTDKIDACFFTYLNQEKEDIVIEHYLNNFKSFSSSRITSLDSAVQLIEDFTKFNNNPVTFDEIGVNGAQSAQVRFSSPQDAAEYCKTRVKAINQGNPQTKKGLHTLVKSINQSAAIDKAKKEFNSELNKMFYWEAFKLGYGLLSVAFMPAVFIYSSSALMSMSLIWKALPVCSLVLFATEAAVCYYRDKKFRGAVEKRLCTENQVISLTNSWYETLQHSFLNSVSFSILNNASFLLLAGPVMKMMDPVGTNLVLQSIAAFPVISTLIGICVLAYHVGDNLRPCIIDWKKQCVEWLDPSMVGSVER